MTRKSLIRKREFLQDLQRFLRLAGLLYLCDSNELRCNWQYIIDLLGTLLDTGKDDETICSTVIMAWNDQGKSQQGLQVTTMKGKCLL